jgi:hypothetical protein
LVEEAHTSQKKNRVPFSSQGNTFGSVSDKRIIKINYWEMLSSNSLTHSYQHTPYHEATSSTFQNNSPANLFHWFNIFIFSINIFYLKYCLNKLLCGFSRVPLLLLTPYNYMVCLVATSPWECYLCENGNGTTATLCRWWCCSDCDGHEFYLSSRLRVKTLF